MENLNEVWKSYRGELIKKGDIVLDLGSSEGYFSRWAADRGAKVTSFDARSDYAVGPNDGVCERNLINLLTAFLGIGLSSFIPRPSISGSPFNVHT